MRRRVQLYINEQEIDLSDSSFILLNFAKDDLGDITAVQNSHSWQVDLPGTPANNRFFREYWRPDRTIDYFDSGSFNPLDGNGFVLRTDAGEVIESGYVRLNSITGSGGNAVYKVTLFGSIGLFLSGLSVGVGGMKRSLADLYYLRKSSAELDFTINAAAVQAAWDINPDAGTIDSIWKVINFAPALNGIPEGDFVADKGVVAPESVGLLATRSQDGLTYRTREGRCLVSLGQKHDEWDVKDLRSYLQRPVLSVRAFLAAIANPRNNGGFDVDISSLTDGTWPYINTWITLPMLPEVVTTSIRTEVSSNAQAWWQDMQSNDEIAYYTLGEAPSGAMVTGQITARLRFSETSGAAPSPATAISTETGGVRQMSVVFIQAVGRDGGGNIVGVSPALAVYYSTIFTSSGSFQTPEQYIAAMCGYAPRESAPLEGVNMSIFQRIDPANTSSPFELMQDLSLLVEGPDINQVNIYASSFLVTFNDVGGVQTITTVSDNSNVFLFDGTGGIYSTSSVYFSALSASFVGETATMRSGVTVTKQMLLTSEHTPADYLLSLCKLFGLYIIPDATTGKVTICKRSEAYDRSQVNLTKRLDPSTVEITPTTIDARFYRFSLDIVQGQFAKLYKQIWGTDYGVYTMPTRDETTKEVVNVFDKVILRAAATVLAQRRYFLTLFAGGSFRPAVFMDTGITYALWNASGSAVDFPVPTVAATATAEYFNETYYGYDRPGALKLQFADEANKALDGADVLCWRNGTVNYPYFKVSDDSEAMNRINNGKPCWDLTPGTAAGVTVPVFSRLIVSGSTIQSSLEFDILAEYGSPEINNENYYGNVFGRVWDDFIADRYNADTKVMRAKVNLAGLQVGPQLQRRFFFWRNTGWVLSKINNYSVTTDDLTDCEFVQVRDARAYGQALDTLGYIESRTKYD